MGFGNEFRVHGKLIGNVSRGRTVRGVTTAFYVVAVPCTRHDSGDQTSTDFIPITTYGKQAENDLRYLAKGKEVLIRGRIRSWYDSIKKCGGFCFEPVFGGVRYVGAPVAHTAIALPVGEHDDWLQNYDDNKFRFDDVACHTRPSCIAARA
ncbi:single-stranded DNA-binding protein [Massilia sp.]|uniref:single-stranded DNA-binding protein n=1 Tax=Massilia sp. TaxID=1882437 RepID=UPI00352E026A